jgi:hypothetical protein
LTNGEQAESQGQLDNRQDNFEANLLFHREPKPENREPSRTIMRHHFKSECCEHSEGDVESAKRAHIVSPDLSAYR